MRKFFIKFFLFNFFIKIWLVKIPVKGDFYWGRIILSEALTKSQLNKPDGDEYYFLTGL